MIDIIKIVIIVMTYMVSAYVFGFWFRRLFGGQYNLGVTMVSGFFVESTIFFLVVLPMKWMIVPLKRISICWLCIWIAIICLGIFLFKGEMLLEIRELVGRAKNNKIYYGLASGIVLWKVVFVELYGRILGGQNHSYFFGYIANCINDGYLGISNARTGLPAQSFDTSYFLQTYLDHSAVVSYLMHSHYLLEQRSVIPAVILILSNILIYELGRKIFNDATKELLFFLVYSAVGDILSSSQLLPPFYLYFRTFEGKTLFPAFVLPMFLLTIFCIWRDVNDRYAVALTTITFMGSLTFTMSAMFSAPFLLLGFSPMILIKKSKKVFIYFFIMSLPIVMVIAYYLAVTKGIITLDIGV